MFISSVDPNPTALRAKKFTANLAQAAATYDLCAASGGDVVIDIQKLAIYVDTVGATFTSVSVQTNQAAATELLSAAEGAVANIVAGKNLVRAIPVVGGLLLKSGEKIQYTIAGATGTGALSVGVPFTPTVAGATLV